VKVLVFGGLMTFVTNKSKVVLTYPELDKVTCRTLPDYVQDIDIDPPMLQDELDYKDVSEGKVITKISPLSKGIVEENDS